VIDLALVSETQRELSPFTLKLDHLVEINPQSGGFYFAFIDNGQVVYDYLSLTNNINGRRLKPGRFFLSSTMAQRLRDKFYKRWYYADRDYVYPLKKETYQRFVDRFMCIETDDDLFHQQKVAIEIPTMNLRKKPLLENRPDKIVWCDHTAKKECPETA
jgi:hypothetical protein